MTSDKGNAIESLCKLSKSLTPKELDDFCKALDTVREPVDSRPWHVVGVDALPDDERDVLTTIEYHGAGGPYIREVLWYVADNKEWRRYGSLETAVCAGRVLAWQELPKPWKGNKDDCPI